MNKFDHWIFHSFKATPESLGLYRILFALFSLFALTPGHGVYTQFAILSTFPDGFFDPPPGPMMFFDSFPGVTFFHGLVLALNISLVALLVGYRTFWASLATGVLMLIGFGFLYSLGKVNHNLLIVILPLIMMWSNWGAAYSWDARINTDKKAQVESWPLTLLILLIGFMMFTAGFPKLLGGWLDINSLATRGHLFRQYFVSQRIDLLAAWFLALETRWFWLLLDYFTVFFEIGFLFAIIHPLTSRIFLFLAVLFHSGTLLMLNIDFSANILVYGAFVNWYGFIDKLKIPVLNYYAKFIIEARFFPVIIPVFGYMIYMWGSPIGFINRLIVFSSDLMLIDVLIVLGALTGTGLHYAIKFTSLLRNQLVEIQERAKL